MLTIKRVETVVSMHQQLDQTPGCGRDCLGNCCIPGLQSLPHSQISAACVAMAYGPWPMVGDIGFVEFFLEISVSLFQ
jgi:hypothetical protein